MKSLGYLINNSQKPQIVSIQKLSDEKYQDIFNLIVNVEKIIFLYKEVLPVIQEYKNIEKGLKEYQVGINRDERNIKTLVQNYFSNVRAYVDTMEHTLNQYYGEDNKYLLKFRELKRQNHDNNFSYRFVETLRNISQHRLIPVDEVYIGVENGIEVVKLIVNKETLLKDKKIKGKMKDEIKKCCDDKINILGHFSEMTKCLSCINGEILIEVIFDKINVIKDFFLYERYIQSKEQTLILMDVIDEEGNGEKLNIKFKAFPFEDVRRIIDFYYPWKEYIKLW